MPYYTQNRNAQECLQRMTYTSRWLT